MTNQMNSTQNVSFIPSDADARAIIRDKLDDTIFVEASAGTGKTTSLVDRVVNLVASGRTRLDRLAAITFTESAAAELRDRVRQQLELAADEESRSEEERCRCREGVADLDQASIRTLHSFAAQLLHERPLEAGLPPSFETTDEIAAGIKFNEAWNTWLDGALGEDSDLTEPLSMGLTLAASPGQFLGRLKEVAFAFHQNYTDLTDATFLLPGEGATSATPTLVDHTPELERLCNFSQLGNGDRLYQHVQGKLPALRRLADADPESTDAYRLVGRILPLRCSFGRQSDWDADPVSGKNACATLKELLRELDDIVGEEFAQVRRSALLPILEALRTFAVGYAEQRRAEGRADFHDLLVWARDLLRDDIDVRDHFRRKFSHILIDEAQDTDPIQAEIAMFLSESVAGEGSNGSRPASWEQVTPEKGKLFVVGDPKQSIYRFRRADVVQMQRLLDRMEFAGGTKVNLVQNFRSQENLVNWVNHVFGNWMGKGKDGVDGQTPGQAAYDEMFPRWKGGTGSPFRPQVWALSNDASERNIGPVRLQEAADIAALLNQVITEGWQVLDEAATRASGTETYRAAGPSDICILMPTRTSLSTLERALESGNIPYRLESASLVFETQEIRDLLNCLRAIDNPADQVAMVASLRSPAFGCSDVDLLSHQRNGGRFDYLAPGRESVDGPVAEALAVMRQFHLDRLSGSIGALIDRFVRERMLMEVAVGHPRMREQWRRYRFLVERAWQFEAAGGSSLRAFVEWVDDQIRERARVTEAPVPESDEEAVRVMTIHAAKGLEFPIVILTGINSDRSRGTEVVHFDRQQGRVEVGFGSQTGRFSTDGYEELAETEKMMSDAEAIRLMYVATTRARDHLVLSLRRTSTASGTKSAAGQIAEIMENHASLWRDAVLNAAANFPETDPGDELDSAGVAASHEHSQGALDQWLAEREALISGLGRPSSVASTALGRSTENEREDKREQEHEEPWKIGRAGTGVGRAVHAVLQTVDLDAGSGIAERARAQAAAEGVQDREQEIARLCRAALDSTTVRRAVASKRYWREVPVAVGMGGGSLHGFIDLLFEEPDGLVVVDYKTDSLRKDETAEAVQRYRLQGGAYSHAIQQLTGKPVKEAIFLYLRSQQEEPLPDLHQAMLDAQAAAESLLGAGAA